jgi:hypothetical protein
MPVLGAERACVHVSIGLSRPGARAVAAVRVVPGSAICARLLRSSVVIAAALTSTPLSAPVLWERHVRLAASANRISRRHDADSTDTEMTKVALAPRPSERLLASVRLRLAVIRP